MKGLILHDFKIGIKHRWWVYVVWAALVAGFTFLMMDTVAHNDTAPVSLGDLFIKWFRGMRAPVLGESNHIYVPEECLCYQLGCIFICAGFITKELNNRKDQVLLRTSCRVDWWKSKCLWLVVNLLIFEAIFGSVLFAYVKASGTVTFEISSGLWNVGNYNASGILWIMELVVPVIAGTYALGFGVMLAELMSSPVIALMGGAGWITCSLFWKVPIFVGNSMMYYRNSYFEGNGYGASVAFVLCDAMICIASYVAGKIYISYISYRDDPAS